MFSKIQKRLALSLLFFSIAANAQNVHKQFEVTGLNNPESTIVDIKNSAIYVSNINGAATEKNNQGYISKINLDGKIISKKWITGLNAPKGLALFKGKLYVADIDDIVEIEIKTGKKTRHKAPEATFLNDLTVDKAGNVYASNTFGFSAIYKLAPKDDQATLWLKSQALNLPNGLLVKDKNLYAVTWGANPDPKTYATKIPGKLIKIALDDQSISDITQPFGNLDGIEPFHDGFLISDWLAGKLYYVGKNKSVQHLADLLKGSADIHFDEKTNRLYVPQLLDNKLTVYRVNFKPNN
ncbi:MAG: SMP-30/gluconolactonase/LRE family protein [Ostreibacterium sp.]